MASSGPYQSHLFNFLNRQTQKVADKTSLVLRHLKVAAIWGTQILVYPVYAAYQSVRIAGRQLKQTARRTFLGLQQSQSAPVSESIDLLAIDAPIQIILTAVEQIVSPEPETQESKALAGNPFRWFLQLLPGAKKPQSVITRSSTASILRTEVGELEAQLDPHSVQTSLLPHKVGSAIQQAPPLPIQGVASMVDTRHMVIILAGNVIYDILTLEQQYRIEQQITIELGSHAHRCREYQLNQVPAAMPLPVPADRPTLFAPLRIFQQLMAWVQRSPVAIATNLFQESTFIEPGQVGWFVPNLTPANLPGSDSENRIPLPSTGTLKTVLGQLPRWTDLEALVWAAIHYFFGNRGKQLNAGQPQLAGHPSPRSNQLPFASSINPTAPWLTLKDLFQSSSKPASTQPNPISSSTFFTASSEVAALPTPPAIQIGQSLQNFFQRFLKPKAVAIHKPRSTQPATSIVQSISTDITSAQAEANPLQSSVFSAAADWIETEATAVGYIKSPWQQFLDWLDAGVNWIEEKLISLWNWLTGR